MHLRIADIDYLVDLPPGLVAREPSQVQSEFICDRPAGGDAIRVRLNAGEMPGLDSWRTLVASGLAWSIRHRGTGRCLCLGGPSGGRPAHRVARWRGDASRATVYCGPEYLKACPGGIVEMGDAAGYPVDQVLFMYFLSRRHGLLVHAAGLAVEGRAILFPGVSGAGKSTLARQFLARGSTGLLSDDRVIVRGTGRRYAAYGTPWPGDAGVATDAGAPLAALLFPARGVETRIRELEPRAALDRLLPATSMLWHERDLLASQIETCERLLLDIPAFELAWSPGAGVAGDVCEFVGRL